MAIRLKYSVALGYNDIFHDVATVNVGQLLQTIPTKNSLQVIAHFLAQLHTHERDDARQIEFLRIWTGRLPQDVRAEIARFIESLNRNSNATFNFINNISALILTSKILENWNDLDTVQTLTEQQELNLFKAYLYCTQEWLDKQKINGQVQSDEDLVKLLLPIQLPYGEILEFKDFRIQVIKALYFFKFCEGDPIFSNYLNRFLSYYNLATWQEYILNLLNAYVRKFEISIPSVLVVESEFNDAIRWFKSLSISRETFQPHVDFKSIREKPVFEISDNTFLFLNLNFLVDKIFQGIQFDFARALIDTQAEFKGNRINNFATFKSIYGSQFSEISLFYKVIKSTFEKSGYKLIAGEELKPLIGDGEPDFYIRDKAKVYLFEYKDVILNANIKHSYNYDSIRTEIFTKMVENQAGSSKGITQLVATIKKVLNNDFAKADKIDLENVIIYPIIVFTDFSFCIPGVNNILNKEFRRRLKLAEIKDDSKIKDCVLVDLDLFIKFQDLFRNGTLKVNNCLNEYLTLTKSANRDMSRVATFNMFLHEKTSKVKYDSPKMLMDELRKILPDNNATN